MRRLIFSICFISHLIIAQNFSNSIKNNNGIYTKIFATKFTPNSGKFTYNNTYGEITILPSQSENIEITIVIEVNENKTIADDIFSDLTITKQTKSNVTVRFADKRFFKRRNFTINHTILLPKKLSLNIRNTAGNIKVNNIVNMTYIQTAAGNISFQNVSNNHEVETEAGNITISDSKGNFDLNTSGGNIDILNVDGSIKLKTEGGNINLSEITKSIHGDTKGGNIIAKFIRGQMNMKTSGGNIVLDDIYERSNVTTLGGSIYLNNIFAPSSVETDGGNIQFKNVSSLEATTLGGRIKGRSSVGKFVLLTKSGDIDLHDIDGEILAQTYVGDIDFEQGSTQRKTSIIKLISNLGDVNADLKNRKNLDIYLTIDNYSLYKNNVKSNIDLRQKDNVFTYSNGNKDHKVIINVQNGIISVNTKND